MSKFNSAKESLQSLVDYASRLERSTIVITFEAFHNWIFQCNSTVGQIFGSESSQGKIIAASQIIENYLPHTQKNNDAASSNLRIKEISLKKNKLLEILNDFSEENISPEYLAPQPVSTGVNPPLYAAV